MIPSATALTRTGMKEPSRISPVDGSTDAVADGHADCDQREEAEKVEPGAGHHASRECGACGETYRRDCPTEAGSSSAFKDFVRQADVIITIGRTHLLLLILVRMHCAPRRHRRQ